jgi:hypothetical protein
VLGVDLFYVLSGFLITTLLFEAREQGGCISLRAFYERRAVRLLAALALIIDCAAAHGRSGLGGGRLGGFLAVSGAAHQRDVPVANVPSKDGFRAGSCRRTGCGVKHPQRDANAVTCD